MHYDYLYFLLNILLHELCKELLLIDLNGIFKTISTVLY